MKLKRFREKLSQKERTVGGETLFKPVERKTTMRSSRCSQVLSAMKGSAVILPVLAVIGCSEPDIGVLDDNEEVSRYLAEAVEGRQLFRVANMILDDVYTIPFDTESVYQTIIDSTERLLAIEFSPDDRLYDFGSLGLLRDAEVEVEDIFYYRTRKITGNDTTETAHARELYRYAYFLKLGSDFQAYAGWKLWGYNGGRPNSQAIQITSGQGGAFRGDGADMQSVDRSYSFRMAVYDTIRNPDGSIAEIIYRKDSLVVVQEPTRHEYSLMGDIAGISSGDSLNFFADGVPWQSYYQSITADANLGNAKLMMNRIDSTTYNRGFTTASYPTGTWNIAFMQEHRRVFLPTVPVDSVIVWYGWCVPYRTVN
jgi:hypothetical protein